MSHIPPTGGGGVGSRIDGMSGDGISSAARRLTLPRIFGSELSNMMFGFGDSRTPRADSVALMEELVLHYIEAIVTRTTEVAHTYRRERPEIADIMFVIRKDRRKLQRVRYLLDMKAEIKKSTSVNAEALGSSTEQTK